jgi:hypothetical protein
VCVTNNERVQVFIPTHTSLSVYKAEAQASALRIQPPTGRALADERVRVFIPTHTSYKAEAQASA